VNGINKARSNIGNGFFSYRMDIYIIQNAPRGGMPKRTTNTNKIAGWLSGAGPRVRRRTAATETTKPDTI
jgi:hypothetical protein